VADQGRSSRYRRHAGRRPPGYGTPGPAAAPRIPPVWLARALPDAGRI